MPSLLRLILLLAISLPGLTSCKREEYSAAKAAFARGVDLIMIEISDYRLAVRRDFLVLVLL